YGGRDATDPGKPFLTLHPGDRYDLGARHIVRRAIAGSALRETLVDSLLAPLAALGHTATVLVAQDGRVLVDKGHGVPAHPMYTPIGEHKTTADANGQVQSSVDELYRLALGLESSARIFADTNAVSASAPLPDDALGWRVEGAKDVSKDGNGGGGVARLALYGT